MLNRRSFIGSLITLPFFDKLAFSQPKEKVVAKCIVEFFDGDILEMSIFKSKNGKYITSTNNMDHYEGTLITSLDVGPYERMQKGKFGLYENIESNILIEYTGRDKFGNVVYQNKGNKKTWIYLT